MKDNLPWTRKYLPQTVSDIQGQQTAVESLKKFVLEFKKHKKKSILLHGAPGCGKTSSVYALANDLDLELLEINASDFRNAAKIESVLGHSSSQRSLFFKEKLLLVDELDGIAGREDRGGLTSLQKLIDKTSYPIVMTANDPYDKKFSTLRKKAEMVEFHSLQYVTVFNMLRKICDAENVKYDETTLKGLARRNGGDLRGAITDLQLLSTTGEVTKESLEELGGRRQQESMMQALVKVFKTTDPRVALRAFDNVDEDIGKIFLWIDENLPREYTKPQDLAAAYNVLSRADLMYGRIRKWQHWRYLSYVSELLTAGIALSKEKKYDGFVSYQPTKRILKLWIAKQKNMKKRAIAQKIAVATHSSAKQTMQYIEYYRTIFKKNKEMSNALAQEFDFDKDEIEWLRR
jgi:replication factor C large subunit